MKTILIIVCALAMRTAKAQIKKDSTNFSLSKFAAQFLISTDAQSIYFNYVGAGLKYSKNNTAISITVFPAFRYVFDKSQNEKLVNVPSFYPGLAVGPMIQHKKWLLGFPVFYSGAEAKWHFTAGIGYTF